MSDDKGHTLTDDHGISQTGDGAKIQIVWKADALKPYAYAFLVVIVFNVALSSAALFLCLSVAPSLLAKSEYMSEKLENNTRYMIQVQYWEQLVYAKAEAQGFKIPPPPKPRE